MSILHQHMVSRRGFCLCCAAATTLAATKGFLGPSEAYAAARDIVDDEHAVDVLHVEAAACGELLAARTGYALRDDRAGHLGKRTAIN